MTSSVFFKFKSQKEPSRVEFDGTGISVFELKRDIIIKSGLGDGTEFDLAIYNEDGNEEYNDDTTIIPRSTSIIARRLPPIKAGAGRAQRYMTGKMPVTSRNQSRKEQGTVKDIIKPKPTPSGLSQFNSSMTEDERMAMMFEEQSANWNEQQIDLANQTFVPNKYNGNKKGGAPQNVPDHDPPPGYVCYRCSEKGHWIQVCPTNDDPNFDNKPRVKRTTGIPRSFLKTVEKPVALTNDGTTDDTKAPSGVMVNAEGEFVVAEPDKASWEKFQAKAASSAAARTATDSGDKELQERGLECSIDKKLFIDPMKTPCCEKTYCNECITNALIESDFTCPNCGTEEVLIDNLMADDETSGKIREYLAEKEDATREQSKSPTVKAKTGVSTSEVVASKEKSKSPSPTAKSSKPATPTAQTAAATKVASPTETKKRPAEELLENPKIPKGPRAMQQQQQQAQQAQIQPPNMMNGFNPMAGFPNMPFDPNFGMMNGMPMMNGFMNPMMGMNNPMMMNPMMGMNPFPMNGGGFPSMNLQNNNMGRGNFNSGMGYGGNMGGGSGRGMGGNVGGFANQQKTVFSAPLPNEEDSAYFRNPVNPHRHRGQQRKARPSDFRTL